MNFINKLYQLSRPIVAIGLIAVLAIVIFPIKTVQAADMSGSGYIIKMGTINIVSGTVGNSSVKLSTTVGQTVSGEFETTGYRLRSGFQHTATSEPFSFSLGTDAISLGSLIASTFGGANTTLTVGGAGVHGYSVKAIEDHSLQIGESQSTIPDTVCDPKEKCTPNRASPWTSTISYGFGYNMSGDDVDQNDFTDSTYFRPFANNQSNQVPVTLMGKPGRTEKATATITFQANISPTQGNGTYENSIQFIALPSY
ncbi:hypothetical protein A3A84_01225 [Candidatus Collierbacteria bacterium RIFCSPLOWO2_01_FULL_50_23]|uniref:Uncharacterized protein n=1 Tax=Candidatus Collierbacteria bacterium RIFCSPHIGHO2_01_FULL_50_25 TaxID=1817722 RepID=A0A1F5EYE5_9BACT|nr:MAG: hypothetical protein A2703_00245 [Candidatus Collierbacteria bacterium RIFCSPHIGHO2_01_FULL_50_25]OGD74280.1 MAG: hypothetical protein A3A84_01225 [Candidatus Collierbacteria bacterium RIFCSPLOWO2_01_FULL_50_23]